MSNVIILVPIYKEKLSLTECVSMVQLQKILGKYKIKFFAPTSLVCRSDKMYSMYDIEVFPDEFFTSTQKYSELLLSPFFYERFNQFDYMLIYQLDAFVFYDKLEYFCNLGYDYIGAPLPRWMRDWRKIKARVGNGGLSLRKIQSAIKVTKEFYNICVNDTLKNKFCQYEDQFFSYCGSRHDLDFTVPPVDIALKFSIERDVKHCFKYLNVDNLPFGCHGWSTTLFWFKWRDIFRYYINDIKSIDSAIGINSDVVYQNVIADGYADYFCNRSLYNSSIGNTRYICNKLLPVKEKYIIWGYGDVGSRLVSFLNKLGYDIKCIYDKNATEISCSHNIPIVFPDRSILKEKKYKIIISSTKYELEISKELVNLGLKSFDDFILYSDLLKMYKSMRNNVF